MRANALLLYSTQEMEHGFLEAFLNMRLMLLGSNFSSADELNRVIDNIELHYTNVQKDVRVWQTLGTEVTVERYVPGMPLVAGQRDHENTTFWGSIQVSVPMGRDVTRKSFVFHPLS